MIKIEIFMNISATLLVKTTAIRTLMQPTQRLYEQRARMDSRQSWMERSRK